MKKLITVPLLALLAIPAFADTTKTSTTKSYQEETVISPAASDVSSQDEMIEAEEYEAEEYAEPMSSEEVDEMRKDEQEKMEERNQNGSTVIESEEAIDYRDRTRTDRERKALNTGSDASDDQ